MAFMVLVNRAGRSTTAMVHKLNKFELTQLKGARNLRSGMQ